MIKTTWRQALPVLTLLLFLPAAVTAQEEKTSKPPDSASEGSKAAKVPGKLPLQSIILVNTDEAARKVAEEASARRKATQAAAQDSGKAQPTQDADGAIREFRPTAEGALAAGSASAAVQEKNSKKSVLKNIHGSAYGTTASQVGQANGESGAVGADSGNSKFNIFVEGEHAHASTPAPH